MPALVAARQPDARQGWFATEHGLALAMSELPALHAAISARPGLPWLVFSAMPRPSVIDQPHGLWLCPGGRGWAGDVACAAALPLASESVGAIILQHVEDAEVAAWLAECERVLVPGGRLSVFALNPLSPYRGHWQGEGVSGREPVTWRRRLKRAGLVPEPVAQGIGPRWRSRIDSEPQLGAGARAAYLLAAEKRRIPMTLKRAPALGPAVGDAA
ncbi:MAG: hypothetical protein IAE66_10640 [Xanthomonadaceae bacterium]|nr:hypothetical protein [Xanthomonadaceae bacterium]